MPPWNPDARRQRSLAADAEAAPSLAAELQAPTVSRAYQCQCGRPVFLRNSQCLACQTPLGYVIESLGVVPLAPATHEGAEPDTFTVFGDTDGKAYRRCANLMTRGRLQLDGARAARRRRPGIQHRRPGARASACHAASRAPFPTSRSKATASCGASSNWPSAG